MKTEYQNHRKLKFARSWQRGAALLVLVLFAVVIWVAYSEEGGGLVARFADWLSRTWAQLTR